jgi:hypothetical protein
MKPIKYRVASTDQLDDNTLTEFVNNTLARLNEDEAPVVNDMETHWELDSHFMAGNHVCFVFALWTGRY